MNDINNTNNKGFAMAIFKTTILTINSPRKRHLSRIIIKMKKLGPPKIRLVQCGLCWQAIEGSHRLEAANILGLIPIFEFLDPADLIDLNTISLHNARDPDRWKGLSKITAQEFISKISYMNPGQDRNLYSFETDFKDNHKFETQTDFEGVLAGYHSRKVEYDIQQDNIKGKGFFQRLLNKKIKTPERQILQTQTTMIELDPTFANLVSPKYANFIGDNLEKGDFSTFKI